jgi:RNA 2',3'-cyclic 3'-phosphodiesterase
MSIRTFIAVEISEEVRASLSRLQTDLQKLHAEAKWVRCGDMHLTLAFLGEIAEDIVDVIAGAMDEVAKNAVPFSYEIAGLGFFGPPRAPRVIWAGAKGNIQPLVSVQSALAVSLKELGFVLEDRPFAPHLTLARLKFPKHVERLVAEIQRRKDETFGSVQVDRIVLIKSQLGSKDERYVLLHASHLGE